MIISSVHHGGIMFKPPVGAITNLVELYKKLAEVITRGEIIGVLYADESTTPPRMYPTLTGECYINRGLRIRIKFSDLKPRRTQEMQYFSMENVAFAEAACRKIIAPFHATIKETVQDDGSVSVIILPYGASTATSPVPVIQARHSPNAGTYPEPEERRAKKKKMITVEPDEDEERDTIDDPPDEYKPPATEGEPVKRTRSPTIRLPKPPPTLADS
jgi:hypothetical protein